MTISSTPEQSRRAGLSSLANPRRFLALVDWLWPFLAVATILAFALGLYLSFAAPEDYQQGRTVRIMFIHVPAVWMAMGCYMVMVSGALGVLVWRHPLADVAARSAAPFGAAFTLLGLITGSLWGRPMWGTYWVWDARLTSFLVLFLIYLGLMALWRSHADPARGARMTAVFVLVGALILPIIKFSVDWFTTLHQPTSVLRLEGPAMPPVFLTPLLVMALAFLLFFITLHALAMRNEIHRRQIRTMQRQAARQAGAR